VVHDYRPEEERRIRDATLDKTLADSFPASDPPSTLPDPLDESVLNTDPSVNARDKTGARGPNPWGAT
jgi:hypothetical protein